jgi:enterochelin esterase-like enzyme
VVCCPAAATGQEIPTSPHIAELERAIAYNGLSALERFWETTKAPLIEPINGREDLMLVTFVWQSTSLRSPVLLNADNHVHWADGVLFRLGRTNLYHRSYVLRSDALISYRFVDYDAGRFAVVGDDTNQALELMTNPRLDPRNERTFGVGDERSSIVQLPKAPRDTWSRWRRGGAKGYVRSFAIASQVMGETRRIALYRSPGHAERRKLLILFDGERYRSQGGVPTPTIIDNLVNARLIPPTDVLFIDSGRDRDEELGCNKRFLRFVVKEAMPFAQKRKFSASPVDTIVGGSSRGGLSASCAALRYPGRFGNVLSLSGSYYWGPPGTQEWLTRAFASAPKSKTRFFMSIGLYEDFAFPDKRPPSVTNTNFCRALADKGYDVGLTVYPSGHNYLAWRPALADGLRYLVGAPRVRRSSSVTPCPDLITSTGF